MGPAGPAGPSGASHTTVIAQDAPVTVWTLAHGLGRYPSVTLIDTAGDQFFAALTYLDADTIQVTLNAPCAGKAFLN